MLKELPKSGSWLNTVKVVLGFIELILSLKFLSVADLEGSLISKAPKKLIAKNTSIAKKMRLNTAPVAISFSFPGPKISVS